MLNILPRRPAHGIGRLWATHPPFGRVVGLEDGLGGAHGSTLAVAVLRGASRSDEGGETASLGA